ncbi:hypothetical protein [Planctomonas psychrotolerans]|uniref:hypothetical protein n=1 Tax=Planctomonas psychrotolerans TaxID=2528712 RepID=UPI001238A58F|nr:hypothetical protein [Planctomonas psychrotolerans]
MNEFDEPELQGSEPREERPLLRQRVLPAMRILVVLGIVGLVLPGILTTVGVGARTADAACADWVRFEHPDADRYDARFELLGPGGVGWECYSVSNFGGDRHIASLGLIPSARVVREVVRNT